MTLCKEVPLVIDKNSAEIFLSGIFPGQNIIIPSTPMSWVFGRDIDDPNLYFSGQIKSTQEYGVRGGGKNYLDVVTDVLSAKDAVNNWIIEDSKKERKYSVQKR